MITIKLTEFEFELLAIASGNPALCYTEEELSVKPSISRQIKKLEKKIIKIKSGRKK